MLELLLGPDGPEVSRAAAFTNAKYLPQPNSVGHTGNMGNSVGIGVAVGVRVPDLPCCCLAAACRLVLPGLLC
jgi:hypothetical protein